jgi:glycosyltransferase involved in cell wall biosynthesis
MTTPARVLIIVENMPVPLDRRVWQEATSLVAAGHQVSVICPKTHGYSRAYELLEGVHIHRHPLPVEAEGIAGYVLEYGAALFWETVLAWVVRFRRGFDVIQACNPPDAIFLVAAPFKLLFGTRFVFDHHDPVPEMFETKFHSRSLLYRLTLLAERMSFRLADRVITTGEAMRRIAIGRGAVTPDRITLVRSCLDIDHLPDAVPDPALRHGRAHLLVYLGVMDPQDGVDLLILALHHLVTATGRDDIHLALVGDGPHAPALKRLAHELGLDEVLTFHGYLTGEPLYRILATGDLGLCPDPPNPYNHTISMNKIMEYMAFGLPIVLYALTESLHIAGDAARVAEPGPEGLARAIAALLDDPDGRRRMAEEGRRRVRDHYRWSHQSPAYLRVFADLARQAMPR